MRIAKDRSPLGKADDPAGHVLDLLQSFESQNVTFIEPDGSWPIVWSRAQGVNVWDITGRRFLDLTAAFGVAATGHGNERVVAAGQQQMTRLLHAMSDVHPHAPKAELARTLSRMTFERWSVDAGTPKESGRKPTTGKTIFCNAGFEAIEAALKTALLATGKPGIIAFTGAYHGLGYGALNVTHRAHFRDRFRSQLSEFGEFIEFSTRPDQLDAVEMEIRQLCGKKEIGAILVEPIQVRGGVRIPVEEFLPLLRRLCDEYGTLLILDEIYTGFGRTGRWFACEHLRIVPDIICLGKGLTGGFPLSACVGRAELMDTAWPVASGDPIHTSTFLGHPVGCAMALAQIREIDRRRLISRTVRVGNFLKERLANLEGTSGLVVDGRSVGLLGGVELRLPDGSPASTATFGVIKEMLKRGFIVLPDGDDGNVISLTPPLTISERQLASALDTLSDILKGN